MSFFVTVKSQLIRFLSLQPLCFPSIIISDPQTTLRDSCYLKHMHSSSRQLDGGKGKGRRGGVEWRDGEVEIHSAHKFFSPAVPMYYAWDCCAYFKGLLDSVYI